MNKYIMFLIGIFLLLIEISSAQSGGKIVGRVVDVETGMPLVACNIIIEELMIGDAADDDGQFIILNIPAGTYNVKARMLGYKTQVIQGVKIVSGLTVKLDFSLSFESVETEVVEIVAYKIPPVQKDLTSKIQARTSEEIARVPITTVNDLLVQQAGIIKDVRTAPVSSLPAFGQYATIPSDQLHFRGGRENETRYLLDGVNVGDALWGGFSIDQLGELAISSIETFTGTFAPQYGEAMSGVVRISSFDKLNPTPKYSLKTFTDKHGIDAASHNTYGVEFSLSSALPFYNKMGFVVAHRTYSTDGYINGFIYPEYVNSEGRDKSGDPEEVSMQYTDTEFTLGKLIWQPVSKLKLTFGGFLSKSNRGVYNHYFKYNPYGTPRVKLNDDLLYMKMNYLVGDNSYFDISVANYNREFFSRVYEDLYKYSVLPQTGTAEFSTTGEDWVYFDTHFNRKEAKIDYVLQLDKIHNLAVGVTYEQMETNLSRKNPDGGTPLEAYRYEPLQIGGYINEKMEFDDMGMIINLGARFDYIDTKRKVLEDLSQLSDLDAPLKDAEAEIYITPRLGISFPVAEKAAIRFGYGHYYQFPNYYKVFQGTYLLEATGEFRPNPQLENTPIAATDIKPEKTVNYEFGLQTMLTPQISLDVTAFFRKTSNLIGVLYNETTEGKRFQVMGNIDYATVKGIELSLKKHFSKNFSAFLNYTFSQTLVSTSVLFERTTDESRTFPANWDQPHVLQGNVYVEADNGFGFSIYGSISSGFPYTRSQFDPNGERSPSIHSIDLNLFKNFKFFSSNQQFYVQILNITNEKNVWWVYADSGIAGDDASEATSHDYTNNPSMYGPARVIQFGVKIWN
ncbi:MAG: TonB-dependent receptor [Ignavibacteria bacterium]